MMTRTTETTGLRKVGTSEILKVPVVDAYCDSCEETFPIPLDVWEDGMACFGCDKDPKVAERFLNEVYIPAIRRYHDAKIEEFAGK